MHVHGEERACHDEPGRRTVSRRPGGACCPSIAAPVAHRWSNSLSCRGILQKGHRHATTSRGCSGERTNGAALAFIFGRPEGQQLRSVA